MTDSTLTLQHHNAWRLGQGGVPACLAGGLDSGTYAGLDLNLIQIAATVFTGSSFCAVMFKQASWTGCTFISCNFSACDFDSLAVIDADGGFHQGTLDANGFASVSGLPIGMASVSYGKDPRDPWDEASYFGEETEWPSRPLAGVAAVKVDAIAQAAGQAPSAAQALLAPAGQTAGANAVNKLPRIDAEVPSSTLKRSTI